MAKIIGNTTATPNPSPDWMQIDEAKADFIKNKPTLGALSSKSEVAKDDLASDIQASLNKADTAIQSIEGLATETYVDEKIADMVNAAPETLDTLNELAEALGNDPNFATTVATELGNKVDKDEIDQTYSSTSENAQSGKAVAEAIAQISVTDVIEVDQTYSPESKNAQSGKAVAEAISQIEFPEMNITDIDQTYDQSSENAQSGKAVAEAISQKSQVQIIRWGDGN